MKKRIIHHPKRITFKTACRYLNRFHNAFMSCAHGGDWALYRFYKETRLGVGRDGSKAMFIAYVDKTPERNGERNTYGFWGNYWTNPGRRT